LEEIFLLEIGYQCKIIITTFDALNNLLTVPNYNSNLIWALVSVLLNSSANIAKIFWPSFPKCIKDEEREKYKTFQNRGKYLRNLLGIENTSPINNRKLRNNLEHFDERLHEWFDKSVTKNYSARNIGLNVQANKNNDDKMDMGNYEPQHQIVTFWNDKFEILPLIQEIRKLLSTTETKISEKWHFEFRF
jgi:hypothetical protein